MEHLLNRGARPPPILPTGGEACALKSVHRRLHDSLSCLDYGAFSTAGSISDASALHRVPIHSGRRSAASALDTPLNNSERNSSTANQLHFDCESKKEVHSIWQRATIGRLSVDDGSPCPWLRLDEQEHMN